MIPISFNLGGSACTWTNDGLRLFVTGDWETLKKTFEVVDHELQPRADMIDERFSHCMTAVANHLLIAIGGGSRHRIVFNRCELF